MADSPLYLNIVERLNADYAKAIGALDMMDLRAFNLKAFEVSLSAAMPSPLWNNELYANQEKRHPMPENPFEVLSYEDYRSWLVVYEMVMRDVGLLGSKKKMPAIVGINTRYTEVTPDEI